MDKRSIVTRQIIYCCFTAWVLMFSAEGCTKSEHRVGLDDLKSPDPAVRIRAMKWAGENKITEAIPLLVEELEDEDYSVRLFAITALERITGDNMGYDWKADAQSRREAAGQWRKYLADKEEPARPEEQQKQETKK